jgi:glutaredoxin-related protein
MLRNVWNNSRRKWKMKVYGSDICIDCRNYKAIQKSRGFEAEFIDITENTTNLREFLQIRDTDPVFASVKENHGIGIPLFVREDGTKTFEIDEALAWIGQEPVREEEIVEHRDVCEGGDCVEGKK